MNRRGRLQLRLLEPLQLRLRLRLRLRSSSTSLSTRPRDASSLATSPREMPGNTSAVTATALRLSVEGGKPITYATAVESNGLDKTAAAAFGHGLGKTAPVLMAAGSLAASMASTMGLVAATMFAAAASTAAAAVAADSGEGAVSQSMNASMSTPNRWPLGADGLCELPGIR